MHGMLRWLGSMLAVAALWLPPAHAAETFLAPEQAFRLDVTRTGADQFRLRWDISPGYYLYRQKVTVDALPGGSLQGVSMPTGERKTDENFGDSEVYHDRLDVTVQASGAQSLDVGWQGCAEAGLCYPPQTRRIALAGVAATAYDGAGAANTGTAVGDDQTLAGRLSTLHLAWVLPIFFGLGLLMTFTPCVLPMLPIVSSLVVGSGASPRRGFALSLAFVLPMALSYAALGVAAALAGASLQALLQNPWLLGGFGAVFVVLALSMFGFYELQLPAALRSRLDAASRAQRGGNLAGAAAMGVLSALLVGPCMTAPLAGALLYIGNTGDATTGGLALLAMGLGMGVPLLLVGTLGAKLLPRPGAWMNRVKVAFGFMLLATAIGFVARVLPPQATLGLWGAWLAAIALALHASVRGSVAAGTATLAPSHQAGRFAAGLAGLWGAAMVIGAAAGGTDPLRPLAAIALRGAPANPDAASAFMTRFEAVGTRAVLDARVAESAARSQATLVEFHADWCVSCKAVERELFGDARVQRALASARLLRFDLSVDGRDQREMMQAWQVLGPPTLLLIGSDARERRGERVVGELTAEAFLGRLARAGIGERDAATVASSAMAAVAAGPARFGASLGGLK